MASFVPQSTRGRPPSGMIGRRPPTTYNPGLGSQTIAPGEPHPGNLKPIIGTGPRPRPEIPRPGGGGLGPLPTNPSRPGGIRPPGMVPPPQMGGPGGLLGGGTKNPYRNPKAMTPELLAQMARRRLGG